MQSVEVPIRSSGKRASARNPYVACKGCSEFIEIEPPAARKLELGDFELLENKDHWHDECFNEYSERESGQVDMLDRKEATVDEAAKEVLEKGTVKH
jgi:hypothetical protein